MRIICNATSINVYNVETERGHIQLKRIEIERRLKILEDVQRTAKDS